MNKVIFRQTIAAFLTALLAAATGLALPNKPGGGGGGSRSQAKSSVNNAGSHNDNKNRNTNVNQNKNVNVNQNKNVNRNTNVNVDRDIVDVDVDHHQGYGYNNGCCFNDNPIATAAAITATPMCHRGRHRFDRQHATRGLHDDRDQRHRVPAVRIDLVPTAIRRNVGDVHRRRPAVAGRKQ